MEFLEHQEPRYGTIPPDGAVFSFAKHKRTLPGSRREPIDLGDRFSQFCILEPPLRLKTHDRIGEDVIRLTYVPV